MEGGVLLIEHVPVNGQGRWCRECGIDLSLSERPVRCPCCKRGWCDQCQGDHDVEECRSRRTARLNRRYRALKTKLQTREHELRETMKYLKNRDRDTFEVERLLWDVERRLADARYRYAEIKRDIEGRTLQF